MAQPKININFRDAAATVDRRSGQGIVAVILFDETASVQGMNVLTAASEIPAAMSDSNKAYLETIFVGNVTRPSKVYAYVLDDGETAYTDALAELSKYNFDWIVGDPAATNTLATSLATWVRTQRDTYGRVYKAVVPNTAADDYAVVNFTATNIQVGEDTFTTAEYCGRIAGILAGTPLSESTTYAILPEITDVDRLSIEDADDAEEAGELVILFDGMKAKLGRGVTSMTTVGTNSAQLKKIKILQVRDLIDYDLKVLCEDNYIGKVANDYDGKNLLISSILDYFKGLENADILQPGSRCEIDVAAQRAYLVAKGVDVSKMTEQEIKEADTDEKVFLNAFVGILDAIEDITLNIAF